MILACVGDGAGAGPRSVQTTRRGIEGEILERGRDSGVAAGQLDVHGLGHSESRVGPPAFAFGMCPGEPGVCVLNFWGGGASGGRPPTSQNFDTASQRLTEQGRSRDRYATSAPIFLCLESRWQSSIYTDGRKRHSHSTTTRKPAQHAVAVASAMAEEASSPIAGKTDRGSAVDLGP